MAWHFNEIDQEVQITDNAALTLPDADWTLGGWLKLDDNTGSNFQYFLSWGALNANPSCNWLVNESGAGDANKMQALVEDSGGQQFAVISTGTPGTSTAWQHVALVRLGSTLTQYINGAADGTDTDATVDAVDVTTNLYFGTRSVDPTNRWFGGAMAEWAKWDRALSVGELLGLAAGWTPDHFPTPVWQIRMFGGQYAEMRVPLTVTNNGSTAADHPGGLIYPSGAIVVPVTAGAPPAAGNPWYYYAQQKAAA